MKAVVAAFNQEKALEGSFSVITNLRMDFFEALVCTLLNIAFKYYLLGVLLLDNNLLAGVPPLLQTLPRLRTLTLRGTVHCTLYCTVLH